MGNALPPAIAERVDDVNNALSGALPGSSSSSSRRGQPWSGEGKEVKEIGADLSDCLLESYAFTVLGISVGLPLGLRKRNLWPLVTAGVAGSAIDLYDGYSRRCRAQVEAYKSCRDKISR